MNLPRFKSLPNGRIQQRISDDDVSEFDPTTFGEFRHRDGHTVRAVKLPGRFMVGADLCKDGYLVVRDGRLAAISAQTFNRDYEPVLELGRAA